MTKITHLYSPKGGQGCTTVAAMMALACEGERLLVDAAPRHDLPAVLGTFYDPDAGPQRITDGLTLGYGREPDATNLINGDLNFDQVVIDHSLHEHDGDWSGRTRHQWLMVVRPCYLALRAATGDFPPPDGIILIHEPGRALQRVDIERTIGAPVVTEIQHDPAIHRVVDAGLMALRFPNVAKQLAAFANPQPTP